MLLWAVEKIKKVLYIESKFPSEIVYILFSTKGDTV